MKRTGPPETSPRRGSLQRDLLAWYSRAARDLPWRRSRDPYSVWISEVMLQQTTVAAVIPYYERFLARYPDVFALARSREDALLALWSGLGYYRRARNLRLAARLLVERHRGRFPSDLREIRALPGVGRYTAGAIASVCFGRRAAALDTNAARVISRLFSDRLGGAPTPSGSGSSPTGRKLDPPTRPVMRAALVAEEMLRERLPGVLRTEEGPACREPAAGGPQDALPTGNDLWTPPRARASSRDDLWSIAEELVPAGAAGDWTQALMELGATICRPRDPLCPACPVSQHCQTFQEGGQRGRAFERGDSHRALANGDPQGRTIARGGPRDRAFAFTEAGSPFTPARRASVRARASLAVIRRRGRILLVRRPRNQLLGGLWELPGTLPAALRWSGEGRLELVAGQPRPPVLRTGGAGRDARAAGRNGRGQLETGADDRRRLRTAGAGRDERLAGQSGPAASRDPAAPGRGLSRRRTMSPGDRHVDQRRAGSMRRALEGSLGFEPLHLARAGAFRHTVTNHRLLIDVWRGEAPDDLPGLFSASRGTTHFWARGSEVGLSASGSRSPSLPLGAASRKALAVAFTVRTLDAPRLRRPSGRGPR